MTVTFAWLVVDEAFCEVDCLEVVVVEDKDETTAERDDALLVEIEVDGDEVKNPEAVDAAEVTSNKGLVCAC